MYGVRCAVYGVGLRGKETNRLCRKFAAESSFQWVSSRPSLPLAAVKWAEAARWELLRTGPACLERLGIKSGEAGSSTEGTAKGWKKCFGHREQVVEKGNRDRGVGLQQGHRGEKQQRKSGLQQSKRRPKQTSVLDRRAKARIRTRGKDNPRLGMT